jgi:colanic acid biosynthesis protein WcaH
VTDDKPVPDTAWRTVVSNVPLVSVDLIVRHDGGAVLGRRQNEPAKGEWFIPGGTVHKNERLVDAVHRVARAELGSDVTIDRQLGVYEHFYDTSEFADVDTKHYVAVGYVVDLDAEALVADDQHTALRVFKPPFPDFHPYVEQYLTDVFDDPTRLD